ncbi:MAG: protein translocase subunit SecD [Candidatus Doudnabacteria bacterium]|nr:protein translocase subunit SecD [Candidatus Doudnabacteria bacterium]
MKRLGIYVRVLAILVLALLAGAVALPDTSLNLKPIKIPYQKNWDLKLGLDLQGGTQLVYEADMKDVPSDLRAEALASARDVIDRRVNAFGVSEPLVQVSGDNRIIVELPGIKDINEAKKIIGQTPFLEFREENANPPSIQPDESGQISIDPSQIFTPTQLSGKQLERAVLEFDPNTNAPIVSLQFDDEGKKLFSEITQKNIGKRIAIFLDNEPISAPTVQSAITDGRAIITNIGTVEEAKTLVTRLNSGALPVPIKEISQQNVGATLGIDSLKKSVEAGLIGFIIVSIFMVIYYRLPGILAVIALCVYILLSISLFKLFGITLTLAGIAGFILSIGMAVDANVLIFERMKEELRKGKSLNQSVEDGFSRAWLSVRDSNTSSLITTFILGYFGTSIIRGFAITLSLGIMVSMFTAITLTRTLLKFAVRFKLLNNTRLYGVAAVEENSNV